MPSNRIPKLRCPICKKPATAGSPDFPFCSEHCRSIDLGKWATGAYVIPSTETDEIEDAVRPQGSDDEDDN
jgi:endogenous inhibitor of DNA gyrase (YacG/DUF329 family)